MDVYWQREPVTQLELRNIGPLRSHLSILRHQWLFQDPRKKYGRLSPTMGQGCHLPPHPSSSFLPLFSHSPTTSPQASQGGARPALLSTTSPGLGHWAGGSPGQRHQHEVSGAPDSCMPAAFTHPLPLPSSPKKLGMLSPILPRGVTEAQGRKLLGLEWWN